MDKTSKWGIRCALAVLAASVVLALSMAAYETYVAEQEKRVRDEQIQEQVNEDARLEDLKKETMERQKSEEGKWKQMKHLRRPPRLVPAVEEW